jgi:CheY-like chemotaxis protein
MDPRQLNYLVVGFDSGFRAMAAEGLQRRGCEFVDEVPAHAAAIERLRPVLGDMDVLIFEVAPQERETASLLRRALGGGFDGDLVLALRAEAWLPEHALRVVRRGGRRVRGVLSSPPTGPDLDRLLASGLEGARAHGGTPERRARASEHGPSGRTQCLVVTPVSELSLRLEADLRLLGVRCELAEDREAALDLWSWGGHSLLVTTCDVADLDGYELVQTIREAEHGTEHGSHVPAIGLARRIDVRRAGAVDMDACLSNPWSRAELERTLGVLLRDRPLAQPWETRGGVDRIV